MAIEGEHIPATEDPRTRSARNFAFVVYALQALGFFNGLTFVAGVIVNYIKMDDVRGTYVESHFRWQIRTFWFGLMWGVLAGMTFWVFGLGILIGGVAGIWVLYRIVKGAIALNDGKDVVPAKVLGG